MGSIIALLMMISTITINFSVSVNDLCSVGHRDEWLSYNMILMVRWFEGLRSISSVFKVTIVKAKKCFILTFVQPSSKVGYKLSLQNENHDLMKKY